MFSVTPEYVLYISISCKTVSLCSESLSFLLDFESDFQIILITFQLSQDTGIFLLELFKMSFFFFSWRFTSISVRSSWSSEYLNFLQLTSFNGSSPHNRLCTNRSLALLQMKCIKWPMWNCPNQQVFSSKLRGIKLLCWTTLTNFAAIPAVRVADEKGSEGWEAALSHLSLWCLD